MAELSHKPILLSTVLPEFAGELRTLLLQENEPGLATQVADLKILDRCRCGDEFCASFYTLPKPDGAYGPGHRCLEVEPEKGMIILDVVGETIAHVEVLYRDEIREALFAAIP
jgi:hypothetical protein